MKTSTTQYHLFSGGLLSQVSLLTLLTTSVILAFFGWQRIQIQSTNLTQALNRSLEASCTRLATALELPLYNFDDATVSALGTSQLTDPYITQISVTANGRTVTFPAKEISSSQNSITIEKVILHNDRTVGTVTMRASTKPLQAQIQETTQATLLQFIILEIFLVSAIVFFLSRQFITPVSHLQKAARALSEGDLSHPIRQHNRDELGQLAGDLEAMRCMLREKINALETELGERCRAEEELVKTKRYLDNIIDSMPSQLIGVDADCHITLWNQRAEAKNSISSHPLEERDLKTIFPQFDGEDEKIARAIASRQVLYENARVTQPNTENEAAVYEDITIYPLITNGVQGAVIRIDDVTEQHHMQQELAHTQKLDAVGQLAGGIAHDFNNMLGGILNGAELLTKHIGADPKGQGYLDIIIQAGKRAEELNRKLLTFARKEKLEAVPFNVSQALRETESILSHSLDKKITLSIIIEAHNTQIIGDLSQIQNALINMGINGSHAMPNGGKLSYRLSEIQLNQSYCSTSRFSIQPGNYLEIEVCDTGSGIPLENQHRIFDPFFTTKGQGQGTGLGLAAVHGTIQQHHGAITLYSEPGKGTCFHIYLPLTEKIRLPNYNSDEIAVSGSGTLLVIDDEELIRLTAKELLNILGYKVLLAEDGQQGLELFIQHQNTIDLVLTDMIMPRLNGKECFLAMQKVKPDVRVLMASGFPRDTDMEELKHLGLKGFIHKPYTTVELSLAIVEALA